MVEPIEHRPESGGKGAAHVIVGYNGCVVVDAPVAKFFSKGVDVGQGMPARYAGNDFTRQVIVQMCIPCPGDMPIFVGACTLLCSRERKAAINYDPVWVIEMGCELLCGNYGGHREYGVRREDTPYSAHRTPLSKTKL